MTPPSQCISAILTYIQELRTLPNTLLVVGVHMLEIVPRASKRMSEHELLLIAGEERAWGQSEKTESEARG